MSAPRWFSRALLAGALLPALGTLGACDPCSGLSFCGGDDVLAYMGEIYEDTGGPQAGVAVTFVRRSGVAIASDSFSVVSDQQGRFRAELAAEEAGEVVMDIIVEPPVGAGYRMDEVRLETTQEGDTRYFGRWTPTPFLSSLVAVTLRGNRQPLRNARVTFRMRGGEGMEGGVVRDTTSREGLFWVAVPAGRSEVVMGDLEVRPASRDVVFRKAGVALPVFAGPSRSQYVPVAVGPQLASAGRVLLASDRSPAAGVQIGFRRTGGLRVAPDSFETSTDQNGIFAFHTSVVNPYAEGRVRGRLHITPPPPYRPIHVENFIVTTHQEDEMSLAGEWLLEVQD